MVSDTPTPRAAIPDIWNRSTDLRGLKKLSLWWKNKSRERTKNEKTS